MPDEITQLRRPSPQGKRAILEKANLEPLVVNLPEAAALIGLSKNTARRLFDDRCIPIVTLTRTRKVIRIKDLVRVLDEIAKDNAHV